MFSRLIRVTLFAGIVAAALGFVNMNEGVANKSTYKQVRIETLIPNQ